MSPSSRSKLISITKCVRDPSALGSHGDPAYNVTSLIVRLYFAGPYITDVLRILDHDAQQSPTPKSPTTASAINNIGVSDVTSVRSSPVFTKVTATPISSRVLHSTKCVHAFPLFWYKWRDDTRDFDLKTIRSTLRALDQEDKKIEASYHWYHDAIPINAIFPPGIPLSAKEILAFYPHHVRWKGVMLRVTHNDYRGGDIMDIQTFFRGPPSQTVTSNQMNRYQRDTVKNTIPNFKTTNLTGTSDSNLYTDALVRGKTFQDMFKTTVLPTFNDLLRGLQNLPTGIGARGLTQCLAWYLKSRNSYNPPLELNVLHTQALIRALQEPLRPVGPQNLDKAALHEWRESRTFPEAKVVFSEKPKDKKDGMQTVHQPRSQVLINLQTEEVKLNLTLPIRHVLTLPFIAIHGVFSELLKLHIDKALAQRAKRVEAAEKTQSDEYHLVKDSGVISGERQQGVDGERDATEQRPGQERDTLQPLQIASRQHLVLKRSRAVLEGRSGDVERPLERLSLAHHKPLASTIYMANGEHVDTQKVTQKQGEVKQITPEISKPDRPSKRTRFVDTERSLQKQPVKKRVSMTQGVSQHFSDLIDQKKDVSQQPYQINPRQPHIGPEVMAWVERYKHR